MNDVRGLGRRDVGSFVLLFAIFLVLYDPVEPWVLAHLPSQAYWALRLAPDALIAALVCVTLIAKARDRGRGWWLLASLVAVVITLVALNVLRGEGASDGINAQRVLVRYAALAIVAWIWVKDGNRFARYLGLAILAALLVQVGAASVELVSRLTVSGWPIPPLAGTTGRYDRFGLLMACGALLLLSRQATAGHRTEVVLLGVALVFLFLSTSRQAALGLAAGAMLLAVLPGSRARARTLAAATALIAVLMVVAAPAFSLSQGASADVDEPGPGTAGLAGGATATPSAPDPLLSPPTAAPGEVVARGSSQLSADPNRNFRLYLNLVVAPWAVAEQPLLGLGPGAQNELTADPRLIAKVTSDGVEWSYAKRFMNDSNYATMLIQFGLPATLLFLALLALPVALILSRARRSRDPMLGFAIAVCCLALVAAAFGPAFEIRIISVILWLAVFAALAVSRPDPSQASTGERDGPAAGVVA